MIDVFDLCINKMSRRRHQNDGHAYSVRHEHGRAPGADRRMSEAVAARKRTREQERDQHALKYLDVTK